MKILLKNTLPIVLFLFFCLTIKAQHVHEIGDSIEISLDGYGEEPLQWQFSNDGDNWSDLTNGDSCLLKTVVKESGLYRARISNCTTDYYSDTTRVFVSNSDSEYVDNVGRYLASDELMGRYPGSKSDTASVSFICELFQKSGLKPYNNDSVYYKSFITASTMPERDNITTFNVMGLKLGTDSLLRNEIIIVSGHYDHLGVRENEIFNGADDNVSGVTAVALLARKLKDVNLKRSVLFITPGAEEFGCLGTKALLKAKELKNIRCVFNYDMVGRLRNKNLYVYGSVPSAPVKEKLKEFNTDSLSLSFSTDVFFPGSWSDHGLFYSLPSLGFTTGTQSDYHRTTDDWDRINVDGIVKIASLSCRAIIDLANN